MKKFVWMSQHFYRINLSQDGQLRKKKFSNENVMVKTTCITFTVFLRQLFAEKVAKTNTNCVYNIDPCFGQTYLINLTFKTKE
jgi:hypothetical protein